MGSWWPPRAYKVSDPTCGVSWQGMSSLLNSLFPGIRFSHCPAHKFPSLAVEEDSLPATEFSPWCLVRSN